MQNIYDKSMYEFRLKQPKKDDVLLKRMDNLSNYKWQAYFSAIKLLILSHYVQLDWLGKASDIKIAQQIKYPKQIIAIRPKYKKEFEGMYQLSTFKNADLIDIVGRINKK